MAGRRSLLTSRSVMIASVLFVVLVVADLALFGWLILKSLSQREIEKVLLEAREEAEPLAQGLVDRANDLGQQDLWVVVSVAEETQTYIKSMLSQRELVRRVEIRDRDGKVVYEHDSRENLPVDEDAPRIDIDGSGQPPEIGPGLEEVEVPIGEMGSLVIGLSEEEVQKRIEVLRGELIRQTSLIGVLTLTLLLVAFAAVWALLRRGERLEEQAREAERLAYIGTLASGLAHEIRNPLNSLSLNMQMLEEDAVDGGRPTQRRLIGITRSEIGRLEGLVTSFLSYARPRPMEPEEVPVGELLERVIEVLAGQIQSERAEVRIEDHSEGAVVRVDRDQMGQLLLNLMQNALAATAETGRRPLIRLVAQRTPSHVVLEIADNGCGIPEAERAKIFDLFYSTRKGGTGLGLAIVERIAHAHHAEVEVESAPGEGTTMRLRLPRSTVRTESAERERVLPATAAG